MIEDCLQEYQLMCNKLEIEITESSITKNPDNALSALKRIVAFGFDMPSIITAQAIHHYFI